jgi:hypothetical protein
MARARPAKDGGEVSVAVRLGPPPVAAEIVRERLVE